jgi:DNA-binding NarL/FixJ family response regulator
MRKRRRILLFEQQELLREGLAQVVSRNPNLVLVDACDSSSKALRIIERSPIDLLITDHTGQLAEEALTVLRAARARKPDVMIMVMSNTLSATDFLVLFKIGVTAIVQTLHSAADLQHAINMCQDGGCWIDDGGVLILGSVLQRHLSNGARIQFTAKELAVLRGVFDGLTSKEIASRERVSESAIKGLLQHLFQKTNTRTRAHLIRTIMQHYPAVLGNSETLTAES